jgi:Ca-activated chloride channel family protein
MEAVDSVDQMGNLPEQSESGDEGAPALGGELSFGPGIAVMEQWLDQVEGDPSYLMRNQFMIQEAQQMRSRGGAVQETRPW